MPELRQATWLKYVVIPIVAVIAGYVLPPPTWADSPGRVLVRVAIIVAAFGLIPVVDRIWPAPSGQGLISTRRLVALFALFAFVLLALGFFGPKLISWLYWAGFGGTVGRLVEAWGGLLLPLVFLAVFLAFMLLRRRRAP
jgi:hypothetical protein